MTIPSLKRWRIARRSFAVLASPPVQGLNSVATACSNRRLGPQLQSQLIRRVELGHPNDMSRIKNFLFPWRALARARPMGAPCFGMNSDGQRKKKRRIMELGVLRQTAENTPFESAPIRPLFSRSLPWKLRRAPYCSRRNGRPSSQESHHATIVECDLVPNATLGVLEAARVCSIGEIELFLRDINLNYAAVQNQGLSCRHGKRDAKQWRRTPFAN